MGVDGRISPKVGLKSPVVINAVASDPKPLCCTVNLLQVLELLTEHLAQWATSISYPELVHLPCVALRGFIKGCAVERFRRQAKQLVDALERNVAYVGNARDTVSFAPQELAAAAAFMSGDKERAQVRGSFGGGEALPLLYRRNVHIARGRSIHTDW